MISLRDVSKHYGPLRVLDGISLDVERGEVVCLIRASGSGKSTLLQCVNGLESIDGGSIEVHGKAHQYPSRLSGGQQQRVALARALAMQPHYMLLDEVTSALDPELVGEVLQSLRKLRTDGIAMLIVTHEMQFAHEIGDRVAFFQEGKLVEVGPAWQVLDAPGDARTAKFLGRAAQ